MARKYGKKASEKVERTMHEFKRGKLKSGRSGTKVTSRKQAIAIGLSQARHAGGKVPPPRHATRKEQLDEQFGGYVRGRLDDEVRRYLRNMRPDQEIDARGMSRALGRGGGGFTPIEVDHALERAVSAGVAVTSDGRWFGLAVGGTAHATKKTKTGAQLDREIAEALAKKPADQWTVHDRLAVMKPADKKRELKDLQLALDGYHRALGYAGNTPEQVRKYHAAIDEINAKMKLFK